MVYVAKWPKKGVYKREWKKLAKEVPEGVRIKITKDPLRRNEIAVCSGSWHEYLTWLMLLIFFQRAYKRLKKKVKKPGITRCLKEAKKEWQTIQADLPKENRSEIVWK